jgi:hypothetical protein
MVRSVWVLLQKTMSLESENKTEVRYYSSWCSPQVYFPSLVPRALSHHTVMYTPAGPQRCTPSSLSPPESAPHATPASEYSPDWDLRCVRFHYFEA